MSRLRKLFPQFIWRRAGGLPECPYFVLSQIGWLGYAIAVHEWHGDDDHRAYHDHGQWFITLCIRGGYVDESLDKDGKVRFDRLRRGSIRFRPATFLHKVTQVQPGTITLLLKGRPSRRWGFWCDGKLIKRDKYFVVHGHHGCTAQDAPVRLRPDGARV